MSKKPGVSAAAQRIIQAGKLKTNPKLHAEKVTDKTGHVTTRYKKNPEAPSLPVPAINSAAPPEPVIGTRKNDRHVHLASPEQIREHLNGAAPWSRVSVPVGEHGPQNGFLVNASEGGMLTIAVPKVGRTNRAALIRTPDLPSVQPSKHKATLTHLNDIKAAPPHAGSWVFVAPGTYTVTLPSGKTRTITKDKPWRAKLTEDLKGKKSVVLHTQSPSEVRNPTVCEVKPSQVLGVWFSRDFEHNIPDHVFAMNALRGRKPAYAAPAASAATPEQAEAMRLEAVKNHDDWFQTPLAEGVTPFQFITKKIAPGIARTYGLRDVQDADALASFGLEAAWWALADWDKKGGELRRSILRHKAEVHARKNWFSEEMHGPRDKYVSAMEKYFGDELTLERLKTEYALWQASQRIRVWAGALKNDGAGGTGGFGLDTIREFKQAEWRLSESLGRAPSDAEIAEALGWRTGGKQTIQTHELKPGTGNKIEAAKKRIVAASKHGPGELNTAKVAEIRNAIETVEKTQRFSEMQPQDSGAAEGPSAEELIPDRTDIPEEAERRLSGHQKQLHDILHKHVYPKAGLTPVERAIVDYEREYGLAQDVLSNPDDIKLWEDHARDIANRLANRFAPDVLSEGVGQQIKVGEAPSIKAIRTTYINALKKLQAWGRENGDTATKLAPIRGQAQKDRLDAEIDADAAARGQGFHNAAAKTAAEKLLRDASARAKEAKAHAGAGRTEEAQKTIAEARRMANEGARRFGYKDHAEMRAARSQARQKVEKSVMMETGVTLVMDLLYPHHSARYALRKAIGQYAHGQYAQSRN